jgi:tetratricopeptide (TPR) repeat protein
MTKRKIACLLGSLLVSAVALGDPKTAEEWFKQGENEYDLGNFEKAADAFKQAFTIETNEGKRPAYLYNVAQAYRQGGRCKDAAFFYKRFLALKENDKAKPLSEKTRQQTEQLIGQMEECARDQEAKAGKPPITTMHPDDGGTGNGAGSSGATGTATQGSNGISGGSAANTSGAGTGKRVATSEGDANDVGNHITKKKPIAMPPLTGRFELGLGKVRAGALSVPLNPAFELVGGYPVRINPKLRVEPGLAIVGQTVFYKNAFSMESSTASLLSLLANASGVYAVAPKLSARGDLGAGMLVLGGISQPGSPFTQGNAGTTGALTMFAVRVAASADYEFTPKLIGTVTPLSLTYSPAKSGLREDIKAITQFGFMVGIGYRM